MWAAARARALEILDIANGEIYRDRRDYNPLRFQHLQGRPNSYHL